MSQFGFSMPFSMAPPPMNPPPPNAFSPPLATNVNEEEDDEEEWEYEYSITEFESYYVTLDLTTPHVLPRERPRLPRDRSVARWQNPGLGKQKRHTLPRAPIITVGGKAAENQEDQEDAELAHEEEDDDGEYAQEADQNTKDKIEEEEEEEEVRPDKVQILDLESKNPIVSYDGNIYSCQWAENIGTEMLFIAHDKNDSLPSLRTLPGNVDLLAMSTARIVAQSAKVEPHAKSLEKTNRMTPNVKLKIPVGYGASVQRKTQAVFLQKLIEAKEKKGESDLVTVMGSKRLLQPEWVKSLNRQRSAEKADLNKIIAQGRADDEDVLRAKQRLKEIDDEEATRAAKLAAKGYAPDGKQKQEHRTTDHRKRALITDPIGADGVIHGPPKQRRRGRPKKQQADIEDLIGEPSGFARDSQSVMPETPGDDFDDGGEMMDSPRVRFVTPDTTAAANAQSNWDAQAEDDDV